MLSSTIFAFALASCAFVCQCFPDEKLPIPILSEESVVEHDGKFHFSFESGDGTKVHEHGDLKVIDAEHAGESVEGGFEYSAPDGQKIAINYFADENGYQPTGDSIPVAPPVPAAIARAIQYNAEHPEEDTDQHRTKAKTY